MPESHFREHDYFKEEEPESPLYSRRRLIAIGAVCATVLGAAYFFNRPAEDNSDAAPEATPSSITLDCHAVEVTKWQEAGKTKLDIAAYAKKLGKTEQYISKELLGDVECDQPVPFRLLQEDMSLIVDGFDGRCTLIGPAYHKKPKDLKSIPPSKFAVALCTKN